MPGEPKEGGQAHQEQQSEESTETVGAAFAKWLPRGSPSAPLMPERAGSGRMITRRLEPGAAPPNLDPQLQHFIELRSSGINTRATSSAEPGEIAVLARVTDLGAWQRLSEVHQVAVLGSAGDPASMLVSARIPLKRIEAVREQPFVVSLKGPQPVRRVDAAIPDIKATPLSLPKMLSRPGAGAIVGVVDFGCDFTHAAFRKADGSTRLIGIWDQSASSGPDSPYGYGRFYDRQAIDKALKSKDPFAALGYRPDRSEGWEAGTHGTHVLAIAAGATMQGSLHGVAPEADLVFVDLSASDIPWMGEEVASSTFGDSVHLAEAVRFIFDRAGKTPCVVNLSLGTNGGPHDGTTLAEQAFDALVGSEPNRAIVLAASNSYADGIHAQGSVANGATVRLPWTVPTGPGQSEVEIWYLSRDELAVELITPQGDALGAVALGSNGRVTGADGKVQLLVSHRKGDPNNGDNVISIYLAPGTPTGGWQVSLQGVQIAQGGSFHAWIERNDSHQGSFGDGPFKSPGLTLGSISSGHFTIVVGSYDARKDTKPISYFSSAGPTRDGRPKPEVSAPGQAVWSARSGSGNGLVRMSGTSMAAPMVTGVVALMLAEARRRGVALPVADLRAILESSSRPTGTGWNDRFGAGRIDAAAAVRAVIALAPKGGIPPPPTPPMVAANRKRRKTRRKAS
jgi:subtilisin family serine protease